jgi:hypothetical protein
MGLGTETLIPVRFYGAPAIADNFAKRGVICVAVSYRLGKFPENIQDVAKYLFSYEHVPD